jgi:hypothetical protein
MQRRPGEPILLDFFPVSVQIVFSRIAANPLRTYSLRDRAKYFTGH